MLSTNKNHYFLKKFIFRKISEEKKVNNNKEINRDIMSASSKTVKINEKPLKLPEISKEKKSPEKKLEKNDKFEKKK